MKVGEPQSWISRIEGGSKRRVDIAEFLALAEGIGFAPAKAVPELQRARRYENR
jgi:hypothetical protein